MSKIEVNQISSQCGSTLTIGQSGDTVTLASGATQSGFGRTGTVDWCTTAKTAPFTGVSGKGYFVNTTCGAITVTLPASPSAGDIISVKDYARTAATNNITFCRNGSKMDGACSNGSINTNGDSTTLIYVDGTQGWTSLLDNTTNQYGAVYIVATGGTVTTCGNYKIHTFTSSGTFTVCTAGNPAGSDTVDYLVVAGGGGGGSGIGGGGGAGGYRESSGVASGSYLVTPLGSCVSALPVTASAYPITIGAGGSAEAQGSNSVFSTITSTGGGYGGRKRSGANTVAVSGGSGGGQRPDFPCQPSSNVPTPVGGAGNTPPVSPPQGNTGGRGFDGISTTSDAGGGGGATAVGGDASTPLKCGGGNGGSGGGSGINLATGVPGPNPAGKYYAGGGGGGSDNRPAGAGATGGGADGGTPGVPTGSSGTANTGGGGGGGGKNPCGTGGSGGSGIVIIRYKYQ